MNSAPAAPRVAFADGAHWPALGLGTWRYGEHPSRRTQEVGTLRTALELGYRVIDTAEMYGEGGAEAVVGEAVSGAQQEGLVARDELFIVTKVYPYNAARRAMQKACEDSLRRLRIDRIDLYLLHWRGSVPLPETVDAFESLLAQDRIARWGVSNFDTEDLRSLVALPGGRACAANQVYLSLSERGAEFDLLPWQRRHGMPLMAYSPIDQGALAGHAVLARIASRHGATPAQVALAALIALPGVMAIPKSANATRLRENWGALTLQLTSEDRADLDRAFPPPKKKRPLAML